MRKSRQLWVVLGVVAVLAFAPLPAQSTGGASLRSTVKDPTGAVVPGADVTLGRKTEELEMHREIWWNADQFELPAHVLRDNLGRSMSVSPVQVLYPTTTNELLVSASKLQLDNDYKEPEKMLLSAVGMPEYRGRFDPSQIRNQYVPVADYSWEQGLGEFWEPGGLVRPQRQHFADRQLQQSGGRPCAQVRWFHRAGEQEAELPRYRPGTDEGAFQLGPTGTPGNPGNDYGELLVGRIAASEQTTSTPVGHFRLWNYEWYVPDNWKVRPGLTLELGVRFAKFGEVRRGSARIRIS